MSGKKPEIFQKKENCYQTPNCSKNACSYCLVNAKESNYSRKCFMTGEYCSKQTNIQRERMELHEKDSIMAFVIMRFSDMSDEVYKWRIKSFIEKLQKYLAFDENGTKICCSKEELELENVIKDDRYRRVKQIRVERADTDAVSNYVTCSRVCQRIQVADLVIVDVSYQNPNVFYEFGLAVALGKLILPICFSESYHKMEVPSHIKKTDSDYKIIEHHIGCYPWRKTLFEYYGIFQKQSAFSFNDTDSTHQKTHYMTYDNATNIQYGFSDVQYRLFPYDEPYTIKDTTEKEDEQTTTERIGKKLYNELRDNYNKATKMDNTLVIYTMDGFLNENEAGKCIVNFYRTITAKMREELCFCGDRVGVLVQKNSIPDEDKDSDERLDLFYSIGEIMHIGVNQATYFAQEKIIKTEDVITAQKGSDSGTGSSQITPRQYENILRAVKEYIRNRGIIIYPSNPVYVKNEKDRLEYGEKENILQSENIFLELDKSQPVCHCTSDKVKCLYHKILHSLRYVNEIVVDISNNSIQSLFWLGVAHGSSVNAIIVTHEPTETEFKKNVSGKNKKVRSIFDVAGLWTAILHSNDTEGFYNQLVQAQYGIEHHAKLMLKDNYLYEEKLYKTWKTFGESFDEVNIKKIYEEEKEQIIKQLESYYRSRFWNSMLRHNQLLICMPQIEQSGSMEEEPRGYTSKWDFKASALLSHYLSQRTVISEYRVEALPKDKGVENIEKENFISLGASANPLGKTLVRYLIENKEYKGILHEYDSKEFTCPITKIFPYSSECRNCLKLQVKYLKSMGYKKIRCPKIRSQALKLRIYKGFKYNTTDNTSTDNTKGLYTQHPQFKCGKNKNCFLNPNNQESEENIYGVNALGKTPCKLRDTSTHIELAQLIIWRESSNNLHEKTVFRVAVNGSSGPATLALSSIFVGETQKKKLFDVKEENETKEKNKTETKPETGTEIKTETETKIETETKTESETKIEIEIKTEIETKIEIETKAGIETKADNKTKEKLEQSSDKYILQNLQKEIRKQLMDKYHGKLVEEIKNILIIDKNRYSEGQIKCYTELVWYAVSNYLYNELYRYFFPLLSDKDVYRLYNGMYNFVNHMRMEHESPFSLYYTEDADSPFTTVIHETDIRKIIEKVPKVLLELLQGFQGLEAFFKVKVKHDFPNKKQENPADTRDILEITLIKEEQPINCLWDFNK